MKKFAMMLFIGLVAVLVAGAREYRVTGLVTDSVGEGEPYATLKIFVSTDSVKPVVAQLAGIDGDFDILLPKAGDYTIRIGAVGKAELVKPFAVTDHAATAALGTLVLKPASTALSEVTVTAIRPIVSKEIDRIAYDVQADEESKTSPVIDILRKVPLVAVQPDGTILVNGSSDYRIYRNGRPSASYSNNAKELFKSIPASSIKKIEVITDPGAREDAEGVGAILNIITMENTSLKGVSGSINVGANTVDWVPSNGSVFLTTQIDKFTISPYFGMFRSDKIGDQTTEGYLDYLDSGNRQEATSSSHNRFQFMYWGFDSSLELDSLNLLTFEYSGHGVGLKSEGTTRTSLFDPSHSLIYSYGTSTTLPRYSNAQHSGAVNYQRSTHRQGETITLSYKLDQGNVSTLSSSLYTDLVNFPAPYTGIDIDQDEVQSEHTAQIDWTRPYGKVHKLDLGAKYIYRYAHSTTDQQFVGDESTQSDFRHITQVAGVYADYRAMIGPASLRAGLRYEYSSMVGKYLDASRPEIKGTFNDFVPNLAASYNINESNTVKLSYATRITRPGINALNPAVMETPDAVSAGNPALKSALSNQINLNYSLTGMKLNLDFTAGYQFCNSGIVQVQHTDGNIRYSTYENVGRTRVLNLSLYLRLMLSAKTTVTLNASVARRHYANPGTITDATLTRNSGFGFVQIAQTLPWDIRGSVSLFYWGGGAFSPYSYSKPEGMSGLDHTISLQKSFLKEDRLTVAVEAENPFGPYSSRQRSYTLNNGIDGCTVSRRVHNSYLGVRLTWRFGNLRAFVKKTKSIVNDDVEGGGTPGAGGAEGGRGQR